MSEIVYKVHACNLPDTDSLGIGSVWKCDCGKLHELTFYPAVQYYHSDSIPASLGWTPLAPRWFDEATQTPVPKNQRLIEYRSQPKRKWWQR